MPANGPQFRKVNLELTLGKNEETRLDAFEMKRLRKILRVSWTEREKRFIFHIATTLE